MMHIETVDGCGFLWQTIATLRRTCVSLIMEASFRMGPESICISRFVLSRMAMTALWIALLLLGIGCAAANPNLGTNTVYTRVSKKEINCYLSRIGLDKPSVSGVWQDQDCSRVLMFVHDSESTKIVVLQDAEPGVAIKVLDQQYQLDWRNNQGEAQVLPECAQNSSREGFYTNIHRQSGFFRQHRPYQREYKVGRVGTDGWLLQGNSTDEFAVAAAAGRTDTLFLIDYSGDLTYPFLASRPNCRAYRINEDGQYTEFDRFRINGRVISVHPTLSLMLCQGYGGDWFIYDWGMHSKKVIAIWTSDIILLGNYEWLLNRISESSQK